MHNTRTSSMAWNFFEKSPDGTQVKCIKCINGNYTFCSSTSTMMAHIEKHHREDAMILDRIKKSSHSSTNRDATSSHSEACQNLVLSLCTSNVPFRFVKNAHFKNFVKNLDANFSLMSPDRIRRLIARNASDYVGKIIEKTKSIEKCVISFDGWDSKYENTTLYALFVYFTNTDFSRERIFLGLRKSMGSADSIAVGDLITDLLSQYGIDFSKVFGAICDGGSNLVAFLNKNERYHIHCAAHSLSLIIKSAAAIKSVSEMLKKVNALATHLSRSKSERKTFQERSKAIRITGRLPMPFSETRWGGCVMLAKAYLNHYDSISALSQFQSFLLNDNEKKCLEDFIELCTPFLDGIHQAESDNSYSSEILVQFAGLLEFVSSKDQRSNIVKTLTDETKKRYEKYSKNDSILMAVFCDSRFAYLDDILSSTTWEEVEYIVEEYCESFVMIAADKSTSSAEHPPKKKRNDDSFFSKFVESKQQAVRVQSTKMEIISYKALLHSSRPCVASCPLQFWLTHKNRFQKLSKLACHILCSPQSSAQVERLFSRCGDIVSSSRRNRISSKTMSDMLLNAALAELKKQDDDSCDTDDDDESSSDVDKENEMPPTDADNSSNKSNDVLD